MTRIISIGGIAAGTAVAALLAFQAPSAHAATDQQQVTSVKVPLNDLNPASPADAREIYSRLRSAAREACNDYPGDIRVNFAEIKDRVRCEHDAVSNAVEQIDSPALSDLHEER